MMETERKELPPGFWMRLMLAHNTTEEQLADAFCRAGIALTTDQISIRAYDYGRTAMISFAPDTIRALVQSRVRGVSLNGRALDIRLMPTREKGTNP